MCISAKLDVCTAEPLKSRLELEMLMCIQGPNPGSVWCWLPLFTEYCNPGLPRAHCSPQPTCWRNTDLSLSLGPGSRFTSRSQGHVLTFLERGRILASSTATPHPMVLGAMPTAPDSVTIPLSHPIVQPSTGQWWPCHHSHPVAVGR